MTPQAMVDHEGRVDQAPILRDQQVGWEIAAHAAGFVPSAVVRLCRQE